jgi:RNA polymerase sigma factor (sigma-70 family)
MNKAELEQLFAVCMPQLQRRARRMLRNPQDCEDAVQDGLLLALRNLRQFEGRSSFSTWLHTIVKNAALSHARRMNSRPQCSSEEEIFDGTDATPEENFVDPGLSPEEQCSLRERSRILREVIKELPSRYEFAIRLCYFDGLEIKDAARKIGVTSCALKTHLFRARQRTARKIREIYVSPGEGYPEDETLGLRRSRDSALLWKESSVPGAKPSKRDRDSRRSKSRKNYAAARGSYEAKEKKSRFWDRSLVIPVHPVMHSASQPAC